MCASQVPVAIQETGDLPPLSTDIHGPCLNEGTSKNEDHFESLTEKVSLCTI